MQCKVEVEVRRSPAASLGGGHVMSNSRAVRLCGIEEKGRERERGVQTTGQTSRHNPMPAVTDAKMTKPIKRRCRSYISSSSWV